MARPRTKDELLGMGQDSFDRLNKHVDQYSVEEQLKEFGPGTMNRNIRDVLAHLHHWHLMMLDWYTVGSKGAKPDIPAKGYTWKTVPELNKWIWEKYRKADLEDVRDKLQDSFERVRRVIEAHSDEELFEKRRYKWTGTTSMGSYLVSATSSHYEWALKLIRKGKK